MKQYTGTKTIKACEMSRVEAEMLLNRQIKPKDVLNEPGYLVEYPDGYKSWSPKEAFEEAYKPSETFIDRMIIEHAEVKKRYLAGRDFSFSNEFRKLPEGERDLLRKQLDQMEAYLYILTRRIELYTMPAGK